jgi:hypothetical protein
VQARLPLRDVESIDVGEGAEGCQSVESAGRLDEDQRVSRIEEDRAGGRFGWAQKETGSR